MSSLRADLTSPKKQDDRFILGMPTPSQIPGKKKKKKGAAITFELVEHSPQLRNVGRKGDVCVKDDDSLELGRKSLGEDKLHQAINPRIMFVGDPGNFRLDRAGKRKSRRKGEKKITTLLFA